VTAPGDLDEAALRRVVRAALDEDLGQAGDVTTDALFPEPRRAAGRFVARGRLVVAGLPVAREVFRELDPEIRFETRCEDGDAVDPGTVLAVVTGDARPILRGERCALNFLMRMCGIATATRGAVDEIAGTGARILDTRKTAPGLRALDKYAVRAGGGDNHRMGLHDAVMVKDTHLGVAESIEAAVARVRERGHARERITVEVRNASQLRQAIAAGAGRVLLDNMSLAEMREAVRVAKGRVKLEASGGLRPGALLEVAETGVDCLSLGWLTHSAAAGDVALELELSR
jgi:nicotinate-nucleotide pyrophosphorylase (carboxylating)